jgi:hypothetical protein
MDVDSDDSEDIQIQNYLTASKIYRDLWTEFYTWEQVFCQQTLDGLSKGGDRSVQPGSPSLPYDKKYELPDISSSEEEFFTYDDISHDLSLSTKLVFSPNPKIIETRNLDPSAGYTACTPISTNSIVKDDPTSLSFAPYADDPLFELEDYLCNAGWFTWQYDLNLNDPDRKCLSSSSC